MASVKVVMNKQFLPQIRKMVDVAIGETVRELRNEIKQDVSIPYPPASKPGRPPHKRSGGIAKAIFAERVRQMDWVVGVRKLSPGRENLGIWLELGTGRHRKPFPSGSKGAITGEYASPGSGKTSRRARPFLLKKVLRVGPGKLKKRLGGSKGGILSRLFGG